MELIKNIIIENEAYNYPLTKKIIDQIRSVKVCKVLTKNHNSFTYYNNMPYDLGKNTLYLMVYKGDFLKPCPGTKEYICCKYKILNVAANCPLNCSYCILQAYFNQPYLRVFVNIEERITQVLDMIDNHKNKIFRIGTGEFTDSLALDPIVGWSEILIPYFSKRKNVILELKTKTDHIKKVISLPYRERIIVSWSLNSPIISAHEEYGAVSIKKRIEAASICQKEGFIVGFHFDPLIIHKNWQEEYRKTLQLLYKYIDPTKIIWISLGSFRYMPELKDIIIKRHKKSTILNGEFIKGLDGKMRYFKPIRIELYSYMYEKLTDWYNDLGIYLCMESDDVWENSFGWSPKNSLGLKDFLDRRVIKFYG